MGSRPVGCGGRSGAGRGAGSGAACGAGAGAGSGGSATATADGSGWVAGAASAGASTGVGCAGSSTFCTWGSTIQYLFISLLAKPEIGAPSSTHPAKRRISEHGEYSIAPYDGQSSHRYVQYAVSGRVSNPPLRLTPTEWNPSGYALTLTLSQRERELWKQLSEKSELPTKPAGRPGSGRRRPAPPPPRRRPLSRSRRAAARTGGWATA